MVKKTIFYIVKKTQKTQILTSCFVKVLSIKDSSEAMNDLYFWLSQ